MENYCAFSKDHTCLKWLDYTLMLHELEEADSLCHGNWIEIERKNQYIQTLQEILDNNHISYPDEMQFNLIKGLATSQTLTSAPHERPSNQTLIKNPQKLCYFLCLPLMTNPQTDWQTLKNFDYPFIHCSQFLPGSFLIQIAQQFFQLLRIYGAVNLYSVTKVPLLSPRFSAGQ